jgi:hypothetical protein
MVDLAFDALPNSERAHAYGVDYAVERHADGSETYFTRLGWPFRDALDPKRWFDAGRLRPEVISKLEGGTGAVFRAETRDDRGRRLRTVIKYSRMAQHVPLFIPGFFVDKRAAEDAAGAQFACPFTEFANLLALRATRPAAGAGALYTKRPLAIFAPATHYPKWKLGRHDQEFSALKRRLAEDDRTHDESSHAIHPTLEDWRDYLMLYQYVEGIDAECACIEGRITREELRELTLRVIDELAERGYRVYDNKPRHYILRPTADGGVVRRRGKLVYALIDFELLFPLHADELRPSGPGPLPVAATHL